MDCIEGRWMACFLFDLPSGKEDRGTAEFILDTPKQESCGARANETVRSLCEQVGWLYSPSQRNCRQPKPDFRK